MTWTHILAPMTGAPPLNLFLFRSIGGRQSRLSCDRNVAEDGYALIGSPYHAG